MCFEMRSTHMETSRIYGQAATLKNAIEWQALTDQFIFCLDLLDLSLEADGDRYCTRWVDKLEAEFEDMITTTKPRD